VRFVVDQVVKEQVFLQAFRFSHISIIPPMLHTQFQLDSYVIRMICGRSIGNFKQSSLSAVGEHCSEKYFHIVLLGYIELIVCNLCGFR